MNPVTSQSIETVTRTHSSGASSAPDQSPQLEYATRPVQTSEGGVLSGSLPWEPPSFEELKKEFRDTYTEAERQEAFSKTAKVVQEYSEALVKKWNAQIDTLLVHAGLYSAVLTVFNVQSLYLLLQPPAPDPTLTVLQQISLQLNSLTLNPLFLDSIQQQLSTSISNAQIKQAQSWAVTLSILWLSALTCSLASASGGIMVKQWIHEYQPGLSGTSAELARLRQYRLNNLVKWRVGEIVALLPVLLQVSLSLFLAGLLVLLWNLHHTVAIVASVLVGIVMSFVIGSTIMPVFRSDCCYLSPPTHISKSVSGQ